jgi:hypothetical protein
LIFRYFSTSGTSSNKPIGETSQGIAKDAAYSSKTSQQRKVNKTKKPSQFFYFSFHP